jgi:hypothetical protein
MNTERTLKSRRALSTANVIQLLITAAKIKRARNCGVRFTEIPEMKTLLAKIPDRRCFRIVHVEHREQLGHLQHFLESRAEIAHPQSGSLRFRAAPRHIPAFGCTH